MEANRSAANVIRAYARGEVRVGDSVHRSAILLGADLLAQLEPTQPSELTPADLEAVFAAKPELVIIGWAGGQFFLPAAQRAWFLERRIGIETMELGAACRTYNLLVQDGRAVIALLFPTSG